MLWEILTPATDKASHKSGGIIHIHEKFRHLQVHRQAALLPGFGRRGILAVLCWGNVHLENQERDRWSKWIKVAKTAVVPGLFPIAIQQKALPITGIKTWWVLIPGSLKRTDDWLKHTNFFELNSMQLAIMLHSCTVSDMARFVQEYTTVWLRAL